MRLEEEEEEEWVVVKIDVVYGIWFVQVVWDILTVIVYLMVGMYDIFLSLLRVEER